MNLSDKIKLLRVAKNISKSEMSRILNIDPSNYGRYEKIGHNWTILQVEKVADALGLSVVDILTGEEVIEKPVEKNKANELTLRDQFALAALPGIITKYGITPIVGQWAYQAADYMLEARAKQKGGGL